MKTCLIGSFPKIPAEKGANVRTAIQQFERGKIGPRDLSTILDTATQRVLDLAFDTQMDSTTDGHIRWYDLFDPLCRDIDNLNPSGLLRLFDNNFYYRHPVITGRLQWQGGALGEWTRKALSLTRVPVKVALPGPFTLIALSENQSYPTEMALLADIVEVLRMEADSIAQTGIVEIQWDEPALASDPHRWHPSLVRETYKDLLSGSSLDQSIALYWGEATPWLTLMEDLPIRRLYVDTVSDPDVLFDLTARPRSYEIGLGLLDARNVKMEDVEEMATFVEPVMHIHGEDRVWVHPSAGLELLPPDKAVEKVRCLTAIRAQIDGTRTRGGDR